MPAVVYHGESGWQQGVTLAELLDQDTPVSELLAPHTPNFEFCLDDISAAGAEELRARAMTSMAQLTLFCMARARKSGDLTAELEAGWRDRMIEVSEAPNGVAAFGTVLRYIHEATEIPPERVSRMVRQLGPRAEEAFMTGAQILRAEGEAKGRAEGKAEGEAKGKAEGKAEVLLKLLELKFGSAPAATIERVRAAKIEELDRWVERIIAASSLDEVFAS